MRSSCWIVLQVCERSLADDNRVKVEYSKMMCRQKVDEKGCVYAQDLKHLFGLSPEAFFLAQ